MQDAATGLTYMQARYYDPVIGRFLATDPIGYQDQLNLYAYAHNSPTGVVDPNGEESYVVARQLWGQWLPGVGHAFVVTNARYFGDPGATIFSFAELSTGNMGNVSTDPRSAAGPAQSTFLDDYKAWVMMGARGTPRNFARIMADDKIVEMVARSVLENTEYAPVPSKGELNSSSAAFAVGDTSTQLATGDPRARVDRSRFMLSLPGAKRSGDVKFDRGGWSMVGDLIVSETCGGLRGADCK